MLVITILLIASSLSLCGAESIEQRTPIQIHLGRLLQNRIWVPVAVGLAIPSLLVARFIFQQGSPPVWPHYSWQFFAWPLYGLTATVNRPANLVISKVGLPSSSLRSSFIRCVELTTATLLFATGCSMPLQPLSYCTWLRRTQWLEELS